MLEEADTKSSNMKTTNISLLLSLLVSFVAAKSSQDMTPRMKAAIIPRRPFGDAEKEIMLAYGQKYGFEVDFIFLRSAVLAAELVINGSVDFASAGIMTSSFAGRGKESLIIFAHFFGPFSYDFAVGYSVYACEITLHLVVPKRTYASPYYNLIKPFSMTVWLVTISSILITLMVRFRQLLKIRTV